MAYVVRDDTSSAGLRRLHVLDSKEIDPTPYVQKALDEGEIKSWMSYQDDELGDYHFLLFWRLKMAGYPIWAKNIDKGQQVGDAIGAAAVRYFQRQGRWPNKAIVRQNGAEIPKSVLLMDKNQDQTGFVSVEVVQKNWQKGVVGVYYEDE